MSVSLNPASPAHARFAPPIPLLALIGWATPLLIWFFNLHGMRLGPAIPYGNDGHCDVWYYFGLASLADSAWTLGPASRMISRIATYLPNFALGRVLPFNAAERFFLLNHTLAFVGAILAVRPLYGWGVAVLATVLVSTSALWLAELSTTYTVGAALAYGMLALACLTNAATARTRAREATLCVAAGALLAWAVNALLLAVFFFAFLPLVLLIKRDWRSMAFYQDIVLIGVGGLLGTALVGLASMAIGQPFTIFWHQVVAAIAGGGDWWDDELIKKSVGIPLAVGVSLALIVKLYAVRERRTAIVAAIIVLTTLTTLAQTFIPKSQTLLFDYVYVLLLVPALLGIAELAKTPSREAAAIAIAAVIAAHIALMFALMHVPALRSYYVAGAMTLSIAAACAVAAAVVLRRPILTHVSLFALMQVALGGYMYAHLFADSRQEKDRLDLTEQVLGFVRAYGIVSLPVIWIAPDVDSELATGAFRSFVRCTFQPSFPAGLPDPKKHWQEALAPGVLLVVLSLPAGAPDDVTRALGERGMALADGRSRTFAQGSWLMRVTIGKVAGRSARLSEGE